MQCPSVVKYNGRIYLWYKTNNAGFAQLINENGVKFTGTPRPDKLTVLKVLPTVEFNGHTYVITKQGVFSCTTGDKIEHQKILALARNKTHDIFGDRLYYCVECGKVPVDVHAGYDTCPACAQRI